MKICWCRQWCSHVLSPGASNKMAAPETNYTPKKSQLFIQFSLICLNNLKLLSAENRVFYLKYLLCCPLDSAARGDRTTHPTLATSLFAGDIKIAIKTTRTRHNVTSYVHCRSCNFPRQRDGWKDDVCMDDIRVATVSSTGLRHDRFSYYIPLPFPAQRLSAANPLVFRTSITDLSIHFWVSPRLSVLGIC